MTRRDKAVVIGLIALLILTSVGAIIADRDAVSEPAFGGTYVEGVAGLPQNLNPLLAATNVDQDVSQLAFNGLTRYDPEGGIAPDLAESFTVDDTGRIWTFQLRADAFWHDGKQVTPADVAFTVSLVQDLAYAGEFRDAFRGVTVEIVDPRVIRMTLPETRGTFTESTVLPLLPVHVLEGVRFADLSRHPFNLRPIGTGPFRVSELNANEVVLVRHEQFHGVDSTRTRPYLDRVVLRFFSDSAAALVALARGEIDGTGGFDSLGAERVSRLTDVGLTALPTNDFTALFLNVRPEKAVFRDRAVRQAIATAIDRRRIIEVAVGGRGILAGQFVPPSSWAYTEDIQRYAYAASEAEALLDGAEWRDSNGDGVRDKGGVSLRLTLATSDEPVRLVAAAEIVRDLAAVGITVELRSVPFATLVDSVARERTFDLLLVGISTAGDPDPYLFFHSSQLQDPGFNFSGYTTLPLDRNLEAARLAHDRGVRAMHYAEVFRQIAIEVPVVFLYFSDYLYARQSAVQGFADGSISAPSQRFRDIADWYVRTAPRR